MMEASKNRESSQQNELPDLDTSLLPEKGGRDSRSAGWSDVLHGCGYAISLSVGFVLGYQVEQRCAAPLPAVAPEIAAGPDLPSLIQFSEPVPSSISGTDCPLEDSLRLPSCAKPQLPPAQLDESLASGPYALLQTVPDAPADSTATLEEAKARAGYLEGCSQLVEQLTKECSSYPTLDPERAELVVCRSALGRIAEALKPANGSAEAQQQLSTEFLKTTQETLENLVAKLRNARDQEAAIKSSLPGVNLAFEFDQQFGRSVTRAEAARMVFDAKHLESVFSGDQMLKPQPRYRLAYAYMSHEMYEEAAIEYVRAIALEPYNVNYYHNLAYCTARGRTEEAGVEYFWQLLGGTGNRVIALYGVGCSYEIGNPTRALDHLRQAAAAMPKPDPEIAKPAYFQACSDMLRKLDELEVKCKK